MRYFIGFNPKLSASKFKNAPVSGKKKLVIAPHSQGSPVVMYKMSAGPLKETTVERDMRKAKEAKARWEARQAEKEARQAEKEAKRKPVGIYKTEPRCRKKYWQQPEVKARAKLLRATRMEKAKFGTYQSQNDWAETSRSKKRNTPEACARVVERQRLRAEAKKKSTSVVITITITDPNKS